jgi:hypothetical protein
MIGRAMIFSVGMMLILLIAMFYSGMFMHGDP